MMSEMTRAVLKPQRGAWAITFLLFFFMMVNFADKAIIGLAGVPIMTELQLSPSEFGLVGSSFFLLFSLSAIVTGFIANHVQSRWALFVMGLVWSLVQFPMLGTVGIELLIASRIVLGAAEGPAYPIALHAVYKWFPDDQRAMPGAVIAQGSALGVIIAIPILSWIITHYNWHWAFCSVLPASHGRLSGSLWEKKAVLKIRHPLILKNQTTDYLTHGCFLILPILPVGGFISGPILVWRSDFHGSRLSS